MELCIQEIHYQGEHERTLTDGKMEIRFIVGSDSLLIICNTKLTVHFSTDTDTNSGNDIQDSSLGLSRQFFPPHINMLSLVEISVD